MNDLKITIIQSKLYWENIDQNLNMFAEKIQSIREQTDLIVLPEMFSTGFSMNAEKLAETMQGKTIEWLKTIAGKANAVITGSVIIKEDRHFYNRLIWMRPDGNFSFYDKRHLFSMGKEDKTYTGGTKKLTVELNGWKIRPMICYDLRFPVWCRNNEDYDVAIFSANWPDKRIVHWDLLLKARAIENQSYVIGVNRTGEDGNNIDHPGHSAVIDSYGDTLLWMKDEENIQTITLSYDHLILIRRQYPFLRDRDNV